MSPEESAAFHPHRGSVLYFSDAELYSPEPHYFVALNTPENPASPLLVLVVATSQIETVRRNGRRYAYQPGTVVEVSPDECGQFSKQTIFDCNKVFPRSIQELALRVAAREFNPSRCSDLPEAIVKKLVNGVKESPLISEKLKKLLN